MHTPADHSVFTVWLLAIFAFATAHIATILSCLAALASLVLSIIKIIDHYKRRRHDKRNIR